MKIITFFLSLVVMCTPLLMSAQNTPNAGPAQQTPMVPNAGPIQTTLPNPLGVNSLADFIFKIINIIVSFSYIVVAFFLILSGFKFVVAQGSDEKLKDAKNTFKYTIIGAILVIGAQVIVSVIKSVFAQVVA